MKSSPLPSQLAVGDWQRFYHSPCADLAAGITNIAMRHVYLKHSAMTLGFETVNDSLRLLDEGFAEIHHYDLSPGPNQQATNLEAQHPHRFTSEKVDLNKFAVRKNHYDAVISNHGIAFHHQTGFEKSFQLLKDSVRESGILAVTLFGVKDEWTDRHFGFAIHTEEEIQRLFKGFNIRYFCESLFDGRYIDNTPKRWHYFKVVAMKDNGTFLEKGWSNLSVEKDFITWKP